MIEELEQRLVRYPPERYPVQHATAQFHLGVVLTNAGAPDEARPALERAVELFARAGLASERAKALNALGAALRDAGDAEGAARTFSEAAETFEEQQLPLEQGAALFNLGLVRRDPDLVRRARTLFEEGKVPAQTAAAAREVGTILLERGDTEGAAATLEDALTLAERVGDEAGRGAAANALGLARLAAGRVNEAIEAFRTGVGAHPRSVRPAHFAMVKANLALAYEMAGDAPRGRLAARQALGVAAVAPGVAAQAEGVLARLGAVRDDVAVVLAAVGEEQRDSIVREEVVRWADAPPEQRALDAASWIETQLGQPELAEPWLAALLELPSAAMEVVIRSVVAAVAERARADADRFRGDVAAAMARFHVPQLERLRATFDRLAAEAGLEETWS